MQQTQLDFQEYQQQQKKRDAKKCNSKSEAIATEAFVGLRSRRLSRSAASEIELLFTVHQNDRSRSQSRVCFRMYVCACMSSRVHS